MTANIQHALKTTAHQNEKELQHTKAQTNSHIEHIHLTKEKMPSTFIHTHREHTEHTTHMLYHSVALSLFLPHCVELPLGGLFASHHTAPKCRATTFQQESRTQFTYRKSKHSKPW